jgi:hypothetical protein
MRSIHTLPPDFRAEGLGFLTLPHVTHLQDKGTGRIPYPPLTDTLLLEFNCGPPYASLSFFCAWVEKESDTLELAKNL